VTQHFPVIEAGFEWLEQATPLDLDASLRRCAPSAIAGGRRVA
jgi:hypothetical protein